MKKYVLSIVMILAVLFTIDSAAAALIYNDTMEFGDATDNHWNTWEYTNVPTNGVPAGSNYLNNASLQSLAMTATSTTPSGHQQVGDNASRTTFNMSFHVKFVFLVAPASTSGNMFLGATTQGQTCYGTGRGVCVQYIPATDNDEWYFNVGGAGIDTNVVIQNNTWQHFRIQVIGSAIKVYHNETQVGGDQTLINANSANANALVFAKPAANSGYAVYIDNVQICTGACPSLPTTEGTNLVTASLSNEVNGSSFGSVTFGNVTGSLTFNYFNITGSGFCVTYTGNGTGTNCTASGSGSSTYFNVSNTTTITGTQTVTVNTSQGFLEIQAYRLFLNTTIASFNSTNNKVTNTTSTGTIYAPALLGSNTVKIDVAGNYSRNYTCTLSTALATEGCNATGIYDNLFTIGAKTPAGAGLNNFSVTMRNETLGGLLYTATTSGGNITLPALQGYYYTFNVTKFFHSQNSTTAQANASTNLFNATLTPFVINIFFRDENNQTLLNGTNVTANIIDGSGAQSVYYTTNGTLTLSGILPAGEYTLRYGATGYSLRDYYFTLADGETNITAYLIIDSVYSPGVVEVRDYDGSIVGGGIVTMLRYYGDPDTPNQVQMGTTNDKGEAVFVAEVVTSFYTWMVEVDGVVRYNTTVPELLVLESDGLWHKIITLSPTATQETNKNTGFSYTFTPSGSLLNNTAYTFTFTINTTFWTLTTCTFQIINGSNGAVLGTNTTACTGNTTLSVTATTPQNGTIRTVATVSTSEFTNYYQTIYGIYQNTGSFTVKNLFDDIRAFNGSGFNDNSRFFIAVIIIVMVTLGVASKTDLIGSPEETLILITALVGFFSYLGWMNLGIPNVPFAWVNQYLLAIILFLFTLGAFLRKRGVVFA